MTGLILRYCWYPLLRGFLLAGKGWLYCHNVFVQQRMTTPSTNTHCLIKTESPPETHKTSRSLARARAIRTQRRKHATSCGTINSKHVHCSRWRTQNPTITCRVNDIQLTYSMVTKHDNIPSPKSDIDLELPPNNSIEEKSPNAQSMYSLPCQLVKPILPYCDLCVRLWLDIEHHVIRNLHGWMEFGPE